MRSIALAGTVVCCALAQTGSETLGGDTSAFSVPGVRSWITGNREDVKKEPSKETTSGLVLMGGGTDVDEAFKWLIERSGGGDLLVLRSSGGNSYNSYVSKLGGADSIETLLLTERVAANDKEVLSRVYDADALWFAGGNQWDYVRLWRDTTLRNQILLAAKRGVPIGGASAGLAVMGQYVFTAEQGAIDSKDALANPYNTKVKLVRQFLELPFMEGVITDSHFKERDRFGRLVVFLARILQNGWERAVAKGIGIDERTAVLVDEKGKGKVVGAGSAYFLRTLRKADVCEPTVPLSMRSGVVVYRVPAGGTFDLKGWDGSGGVEYKVVVERGKIESSQDGGAIY